MISYYFRRRDKQIMDNLQYDSFYKFIVSVGIILIVAPLFFLHYLVSGSYDIIMTQDEANNLSDFSSDFLSIKVQYVHNIFKYLPCICIVFIVLGLFFILWGCFKWIQIQKTLDQMTKLDLEEKELHIQNMSAQEIAEKIISEDMENQENLSSNHHIPSSYSMASSRIRKAFEIEDACYNYLRNKLKQKYNVRQNIKVGNCDYDIIASSKYNNIDLLYEIKYWSNPISKANLARLISQVEQRGISYENTAHRNFRFIILIISQEDCFSQTIEFLNNLIAHKNLSFISIEYMKEEQLFS